MRHAGELRQEPGSFLHTGVVDSPFHFLPFWFLHIQESSPPLSTLHLADMHPQQCASGMYEQV